MSDNPENESSTQEPRKFPLRMVSLALLTAVLLLLSAIIVVPYLHAITWGIALAIMGWPIHKRIRGAIAQPTAAAGVSTALVLLVIVAPGLFFVYEVGREAARFTVNTDGNRLVSRDNLDKLPLVPGAMAWLDRLGVDSEQEARKFLVSLLPELNGLAYSSATVAVQFLVAMYILFYVFRDRGEFMSDLRDMLPLTNAEADRLLTSAADSVYANLYATVVTSLINTVTGTLLFLYVGVPAAIFWGAVMFILGILPIVGAGLVWVPIALYLTMTGDWLSGSLILIWGIACAVIVDYIVFARLAGSRMRMHPVPALIAFLGGLAVFGLSGVILGPAIVAVTSAFLELWRERNKGTGSALTDAA